MTQRASGKTLAILATDGFEEVELTSPRDAIESAGGKTVLISPEEGTIEANKHRQHGERYTVDVALPQADASDYDALLIPGGLFSPDALRTNDEAIKFVRDFFANQKPVFAICHGPQLLISAEVVEGRHMTGYKAIQKDLKNAGANVDDVEVIVDSGLVTSRSPDDLEAFNAKIIEEICEGDHDGQTLSAA